MALEDIFFSLSSQFLSRFIPGTAYFFLMRLPVLIAS